MLWLSAALAFATTMFILSMITSMFVETVHRLLAFRVKGLRLMLGHFFDRVIASYYQDTDQAKLAGLKAAFLDTMTVNRSPAGTAFEGITTRTSDAKADDAGLWNWSWQGRRLDHLDVKGFLARLGASDFGDHIRTTCMGAADAALKDMAEKFQAFGDEASDFFARRARLLSVMIAIVVAWGFNVNPHTLLTTFLQNSDITNKVIELQEGTSQAEVDAAHQAMVVAEAGSDAAAKEAASKAWRDAVASANARVEQLQQAGVPIGWNDQRLSEAGFAKSSFLHLVPVSVPSEWSPRSRAAVLWLIIGGMLIGLGSPFWYDMVRSLTNLRALTSGSSSEAQARGKPADEPAADQTQGPISHFWTAAAARDNLSDGGRNIAVEDQAVG